MWAIPIQRAHAHMRAHTHTQPDIGASSIVAVKTIVLEIGNFVTQGHRFKSLLKNNLKINFLRQVFL